MKKDDKCFRCNGSGMLSNNGWCAGWCGQCNGSGRFSWEEVFAKAEEAKKKEEDVVGDVPPKATLEYLESVRDQLPRKFKKKGKKNG